MSEKLISHQMLRFKRWYKDVRSRTLRYMKSGHPLDLPVIVSYCTICGYQRTHTLKTMYVDSCVFECDTCKTYNKNNMETRTMKEETKDNDSSSKDLESKDKDTSIINTSVQDADTNKSIPSIEDVLPDGDAFTHPLLEVYLDGGKKKEAVLERAEVIDGSYGESVVLMLDGESYRSNSKAIIGQVKKLLEMDCIPVKVCVAQVTGKSGRKYYTLRG